MLPGLYQELELLWLAADENLPVFYKDRNIQHHQLTLLHWVTMVTWAVPWRGLRRVLASLSPRQQSCSRWDPCVSQLDRSTEHAWIHCPVSHLSGATSQPEWGWLFLPSDPPEGRETTSGRKYLHLTVKLVHQTKETFQSFSSSTTMTTFFFLLCIKVLQCSVWGALPLTLVHAQSFSVLVIKSEFSNFTFYNLQNNQRPSSWQWPCSGSG